MSNTGMIRVGVEIRTNELRAVAVDQDVKLAATRSIAFDPAEETAQQVKSLIGALKEDVGDFDRLGVAVPGLVDQGTHRVAFSAHIPEHSNFDLIKEISSATGLIASIENDANSAAYGEFILGAARGTDNFFYATLGEGVGGAFILGGEIWRGASGFAGEFGFVPINSEGMRLEEVASTENIVRRTKARFHQDSTSSLNSLDEESITLDNIIGAAREDDDFAQMMLARTGVYVGTAIASVINLLNLEKVVVGGEIMDAKNLVLDAIVERARELSFAPSFEAVSIVEGELGEFAAATGAALLAEK